ncbi:hypothetical protein AURDEDRAFT_175605 [Auricularia subglabra TFB-10046 SS5]|nr:hypothetical protein AURDEDRAFT_175605 [Auricularia subglabra TFB-10046 SS5]
MKSLKDSIAAAAVHLPELQGAATAARRARSRPIYCDGPAKAVPALSQVPEPVRVKYGYACQTMPSRRLPPPCDELEEIEVIVFPAPERPNSTLHRMETMLEDLRANGLNAEIIRRNFRRRD